MVPPPTDGARPGNYAEQAATYDRTRGASPTIVRVLAGRLGAPSGRLLLDVAGGTGNYALPLSARGFRVVVVDASLPMLARAARKLRPALLAAGDGEALPIADHSVDCAVLVHGVHLMKHPDRAFAEARRVIRGGPFVLVDVSRDNAPLFVYEYFGLEPGGDARPTNERFASELREAGFSRVEHEPVVFTDSADGSLHALHTNALHLAGRAYLRNTSFWHRLDDDRRSRGLEALARDLRSGRLEERVRRHYRVAAARGHETAFAAWP